jgi:hypothetical protein
MNDVCDLESMILVWEFHEAPEEYQLLSKNGGDEDWVVVIHKTKWDSWQGVIPSWITNMDTRGDPHIHFGKVPYGENEVVIIGSHS